MLKFDIAKVRFDYVLVNKITSNAIYVVSDRNGFEYRAIDAVRGSHNGRLVRKVKIHDRVSRGYFLYNSLKEFDTPRLACFFVYDGEVLGIELQRFNYKLGDFDPISDWVSFSERCMKNLDSIIKDKDDVFINGTEVFWPARDSKGELYDAARLDISDKFHLCFVDYVRLNRIGIASFIRRENRLLKGLDNPKPEILDVEKKEGQADKVDDKDIVDDKNNEDVMLVVQTGTVLRYSVGNGIISYSSVLKNDLKIGSSHVNESRQLQPLFAADSKSKPNLKFVKMAGTVIGGIYGVRAVDFLNIPEIIEKTGEVCLFNIEDRHAEKICIDMDAKTCLAWILGFLGKETRLNELHSLNRMFRSAIKNGFTEMSANNEIDASKNGVNVSELPLVKYKTIEERLKDAEERKQKLEIEGVSFNYFDRQKTA